MYIIKPSYFYVTNSQYNVHHDKLYTFVSTITYMYDHTNWCLWYVSIIVIMILFTVHWYKSNAFDTTLCTHNLQNHWAWIYSSLTCKGSCKFIMKSLLMLLLVPFLTVSLLYMTQSLTLKLLNKWQVLKTLTVCTDHIVHSRWW